MAPKKKSKRQVKRPTHQVAGGYRKRATVFVERLRGKDEDARYIGDDLMATDAYIVITNRYLTDWSHTVELKGEIFRLPGKVVDRLISQREAIIKQQRSDRGREIVQRRVQELQEAVGNPEQAEAELEAEMQRDLGGGCAGCDTPGVAHTCATIR